MTHAVCRCFYRPQKPFKDYIEKIIQGKVQAVKPTARDLQVSCLPLMTIAWCVGYIYIQYMPLMTVLVTPFLLLSNTCVHSDVS